MQNRIDNTGFGDIKIFQSKEGFSYGVDAVLLADFASRNISKGCSLMDLGTGNGIIPLILCHKTNVEKIYGVEAQKESCQLALESVKINNLQDRISIINMDIRELNDEVKVDYVTTNPPYMKVGSGIKNQDEKKSIARHEFLGGLDDFFKVAYRVLKEGGTLFMVHRPNRLVDILSFGRKNRMEAKYIEFVHPKPNEGPNIVLVKFKKNGGSELKYGPPIFIRNENGKYSKKALEIYEKQL